MKLIVGHTYPLHPLRTWNYLKKFSRNKTMWTSLKFALVQMLKQFIFITSFHFCDILSPGSISKVLSDFGKESGNKHSHWAMRNWEDPVYSVFQGLICIWVELPKGSIIRNLNISQDEEGILVVGDLLCTLEITLHNSAYAFGRLFCF